jgi:hypothetical protein
MPNEVCRNDDHSQPRDARSAAALVRLDGGGVAVRVFRRDASTVDLDLRGLARALM